MTHHRHFNSSGALDQFRNCSRCCSYRILTIGCLFLRLTGFLSHFILRVQPHNYDYGIAVPAGMGVYITFLFILLELLHAQTFSFSLPRSTTVQLHRHGPHTKRTIRTQVSENDQVEIETSSQPSDIDSSGFGDSRVTGTSFLSTLRDPSGQPFRKILAVVSSLLGCGLFAFQYTQPVNGIALLHAMEKDSPTLREAFCNGKPTLVEFYADWCESCKVLAPTMRNMELKYKNNVNFITVDGVNPQNSNLVQTFKVDGIPHVAFISKDAEVKTALVGAVPSSILNTEISSLIQNKDLPYDGYDAFEEQSHYPFGGTDKICRTN